MPIQATTKATRILMALAAAIGLALLCSVLKLFHFSPNILSSPMQQTMLMLFIGLFAIAVLYLALRQSLFTDTAFFAIAVALLALAVVLRIECLDQPQRTVNGSFYQYTQDYNGFLSQWVAALREFPFKQALSTEIGDYNLPYIYILTLISRSSLPDVFLIKWVSVIFDVALAIAVTELVRHFTQKRLTLLLAFTLTLFTPITWLNSAYWAQCDAIYVLFIVLALLFALKNQLFLSLPMAALAFAFKLQTIFFLPIYLLILLQDKLTWKKLAAFFTFPLVYFATITPALLAGRSLESTFSIYLNQAGSYSSYLCLNCGNLLAYFFPDIKDYGAPAWVSTACIAAAILFMGAVLLYAIHTNKTKGRDLLTASFLLSLGIVWFLPHMHDRYYYIADILAIAYVATAPRDPRAWIVPLLVFIGSFSGYSQYFSWWWNGAFTVSLAVGATAIAAAIVMIAWLWITEPKLQLTDPLEKQDES